jgi:hypothetical protein
VRLKRPNGLLALLRQGITLGVDFGPHSLETLLSVAQTIEGSVYEPGSMRRTREGLELVLDNPPLRVGAFAEIRVLVDGVAIPAERVRLRPGADDPWRSAATVTPGWTYDLGPGDRIELRIVGAAPDSRGPVRVRIELRTLAIPPLVWCEVHDTPSSGPGER